MTQSRSHVETTTRTKAGADDILSWPLLCGMALLVAVTAGTHAQTAEFQYEGEIGCAATNEGEMYVEPLQGMLQRPAVLYLEDSDKTTDGPDNGGQSSITNGVVMEQSPCGLRMIIERRNMINVWGEHPCDWDYPSWPADFFPFAYGTIDIEIITEKPARIMIEHEMLESLEQGSQGFGIEVEFPQGEILMAGTHRLHVWWDYSANCPGNEEHMHMVDLIEARIYMPEFPNPDLNCDGFVDGQDLAIVLANWGNQWAPGDLDWSDSVDGADLGMVLAAWTG
ncbi:MAG: hypothetical protein CMJ32_00250 [Phycisphaerae bacterium]|nr:hypothetical protein [Phycisphaerae bacterium]